MFSIRMMLAAIALIAMAAPAAARETWHRADTDQFIIYSDGKPRNLEKFAYELERFDALLRFMWQKEPVQNPNRLTVYLVKDASAAGKLYGADGSNIAGFYRPSSQGSFAVGNRRKSSQRGVLNGRHVLFHEYAHHFMYQNFAVPAPSWFVEGFADYVSTAEIKKDGHWTLGKAAGHRQLEMAYNRIIPMRELLTNRFDPSAEYRGFYGWSWGLTHMLYSREQGRGRKISRYLSQINTGAEPLAAAEAAFGDLDDLEKALRLHIVKPTVFQKSTTPLAVQTTVAMTQLSEAQAALIKPQITLALEAEPESNRTELQALTAEYPGSAQAWYLLAEAEFRLAKFADSESQPDLDPANTAIDRALSLDPAHMRAHVLKGKLLLEILENQDELDEEASGVVWETARSHFATARKIAPNHPWPLFEQALSFRRQGVNDPSVSPAFKTAFAMAPEARDIRFAFAIDVATDGEFDQAIQLLKVIANNPHGNGGNAQDFIDRFEASKAKAATEEAEDEDNAKETDGTE